MGPPAAGKSTWIYKNMLMHNNFVASSDQIIEEIANDYDLSYNECFKNLIGFADQVFWHNLKLANFDGENVIIDRTNMSVKSRKRYFELFKDYEFHAVVFPAPEKKEWDRRLNSRPGKNIPEEVIAGMLKSFEMPTIEEGFSSITIIEPELETI